MVNKILHLALPSNLVDEAVLAQMAESCGVLASVIEVHLGTEEADVSIEIEGVPEQLRAACAYLQDQGIPYRE